MIDKLAALMTGGAVKRYHTAHTIRQQTVADHSHGVAMVVLTLRPLASAALIKAALTHDLAESVTGDIPAPAKWRCSGLKCNLEEMEREFDAKWEVDWVLTDDEKHLLKWADMAELVVFCLNEYHMGNRAIAGILSTGLRVLREYPSPSHEMETLREQLNDFYGRIR